MEQFTDNSTRVHYDLRLRLNPAGQEVGVSGSLVYHAAVDGLERVRFYLHRQFNIQRLSGRRVLGYHFEKYPKEVDYQPYFPEAGMLDIYFDPPLAAGSTGLVQFDYTGVITDWPLLSANIVTPDWVELGMYLPWYPLAFEETPANLTFTLQVMCPKEYQVASLGETERQGNIWYYNWPYPTNDIVVAAGPNLQTYPFESESNKVILHSATFKPETVALLGEDLLWTLERFAGWFGPIRPNMFNLIESPRAQGGGYARRGLVVLGGLNEGDYLSQREAYLRYLGHEAAHAWWFGAPAASWEDWLNESFAEYAALMAIRERYGVEAFNRRLERKREQVGQLLPDGSLPLWGFDRNDTLTQEKQERVEAQLYHKGPLLLNDLAERIGYRRFLDLCRGMQWSGVTTTGHFLDLLQELEGEDVRAWMERALKNQ